MNNAHNRFPQLKLILNIPNKKEIGQPLTYREIDCTDRLIGNGYQRKLAIGKEGKHEIQTCTIQLKDANAIASLILHSEHDIVATLTTNDGVPWFKGIVRPYINLSVSDKVQPIKLQILDMSAKLEYMILEEKRWTNLVLLDPSNKEHSLIHKLFSLVENDDDISPEKVIAPFSKATEEFIFPTFVCQSQQHVSSLLEDVLYEHGLTYRATEDGSFEIIDIAPETLTIPEELYLDNDAMRIKLDIKRQDDSQRGVNVEWHPIINVSNAVLYDSNVPGEGKRLACGEVYPEKGDTAYVPYLYRDSQGNERIIHSIDTASLNIDAIEYEYTGNNDLLELGADLISVSGKCKVFIKTNDPSVTLSSKTKKLIVKKLQVRGDIQIESDAICKLTEPGPNPKTYTSKYLRNAYTAGHFLNILIRRQTAAKLSYSFSSFNEYPIGCLASIRDETSGIADSTIVLITSRNDSGVENPLYQYECEGMTGIEYDFSYEELLKIPNYAQAQVGENPIMTLTLSDNAFHFLGDDNPNPENQIVTATVSTRETLTGWPVWYINNDKVSLLENSMSLQIPIGSMGNHQQLTVRAEIGEYSCQKIIRRVQDEIIVSEHAPMYLGVHKQLLNQRPDNSHLRLGDHFVFSVTSQDGNKKSEKRTAYVWNEETFENEDGNLVTTQGWKTLEPDYPHYAACLTTMAIDMITEEDSEVSLEISPTYKAYIQEIFENLAIAETVESSKIKLTSQGSIEGDFNNSLETGWCLTGDGTAIFHKPTLNQAGGTFAGSVDSPVFSSFAELKGNKLPDYTGLPTLWDSQQLYEQIESSFNGPGSNPFGDGIISSDLNLFTGNYKGELIEHLYLQKGVRTPYYEDAASHTTAIKAHTGHTLHDWHYVPESETLPHNSDPSKHTYFHAGDKPIFFEGSSSIDGSATEVYFTIYRAGNGAPGKEEGNWLDLSEQANGYLLPGDMLRLHARSWALWGSRDARNKSVKFYTQTDRMVDAWTMQSYCHKTATELGTTDFPILEFIIPETAGFVDINLSKLERITRGNLLFFKNEEIVATNLTSYQTSVNPGDRITIIARCEGVTITEEEEIYDDDGEYVETITNTYNSYGWVKCKNLFITAYGTHAGKGLVVKTHTNTHFIPYHSGFKRLRNESIKLTFIQYVNRTGPSWVWDAEVITGISTPKQVWIKGDDFITSLSLALATSLNLSSPDYIPKNFWIDLDTQNNLNSVLINGVTSIVNQFIITNEAIRFRTNLNNEVIISRFGSQDQDNGSYSSLAYSLQLIASAPRVETASIFPKTTATHDIGAFDSRFRDIYLSGDIHLRGTINAEGEIRGKKVYGAVFN